MPETQNMKHIEEIDIGSMQYQSMRPKSFKNIAIKQRTYGQLLALSTNLQDSFDKIIQRLLAEHIGHKKEQTSESGSGLVTRDQIPAITTIVGMGDKLAG